MYSQHPNPEVFIKHGKLCYHYSVVQAEVPMTINDGKGQAMCLPIIFDSKDRRLYLILIPRKPIPIVSTSQHIKPLY